MSESSKSIEEIILECLNKNIRISTTFKPLLSKQITTAIRNEIEKLDRYDIDSCAGYDESSWLDIELSKDGDWVKKEDLDNLFKGDK